MIATGQDWLLPKCYVFLMIYLRLLFGQMVSLDDSIGVLVNQNRKIHHETINAKHYERFYLDSS